MALNASGPISLGGSTTGQSIALELGLSATGQISLNDAAVRTLAQVASGAIVMPTNFWGKANTPSGSLYSFGFNVQGQVGDNTVGGSRSSPVLTLGGSTWNEAYSGRAAIKTDGTLWLWGDLSNKSAGDGTSTTYRSSPVQLGALTNWKYVSATTNYTMLASKTDGTLWVWGLNGPQTGLNNPFTYPSSPVQIGSLTNWAFVSGCGGPENAAAVKTDGTLWIWGQNRQGEAGINFVGEKSSPTQIGALTDWSIISVGGVAMIQMLKTNGTLWGSGYAQYIGANLGIGTVYSSPVQIGALTNWKILSRYPNESIAAIKSDGTLWGWGYQADYGNIGTNNRINYSSPVQIGALTTWNYVATVGNGDATIATKTDGTLWSWGSNSHGQLGLNISSLSYRSSPVQVGALTDWKGVFGSSEGPPTVAAVR